MKNEMYDELCKVLQSILNKNGFKVETFNESILLNLMQSLGYPVVYETDRDISLDFKKYCENGGINLDNKKPLNE